MNKSQNFTSMKIHCYPIQEKFINFYCKKENIYFATSYNKSSINGFATHAKLLPMEIFFSELHIQKVIDWINFIIFKAIEQPVINKPG